MHINKQSNGSYTETRCPYTKFINFCRKAKNIRPQSVSYRVMLLGPICFFLALLGIVSADMIASCGLYGKKGIVDSTEIFIGSFSQYTPQCVKVEGKAGYLLLGGMITMVLLFPKWVITQYLESKNHNHSD